MPIVILKGTYGYGRPRRYYGPGTVDVPEGLARALGLTPAFDAAPVVPEIEPPPPALSEPEPAPALKRRKAKAKES